MASGTAGVQLFLSRVEEVSILVLVKYGLGTLDAYINAPTAALVSILVLVKYGLGIDLSSPSRSIGDGLNSCSGEVWPRDRAPQAQDDPDTAVSILVLVKYGLGLQGQRARVPARRVSIFVLVKYGLGAEDTSYFTVVG